MQTTVLIVHTLIALGIIILVLMQRGKGAEAGAAFGAGASGTVFGSRGSTNFFSRATAILATAFFATSLSLAWISSQSANTTDSLIEDMPATEMPQAAPEVIPRIRLSLILVVIGIFVVSGKSRNKLREFVSCKSEYQNTSFQIYYEFTCDARF